MAFENSLNDKMNDSQNDPFDEFEFKPLTDGLGFHQKNDTTTSKIDFRGSNLNFDVKNTEKNPERTVERTVGKNQGLTSPLPRSGTSTIPTSNTKGAVTPRIQVPILEDDSISKAQTAVNEILKNLNHKKQQEDALLKNKKKLVWKHTTPSFAAAFLDTMLIMAGFLMMLIAMLAITKSDLISNITHPGEDYSIWIATALLFATLYFSYMVLCRAYLGYTPGEWAFDQRCGTELEQAGKSYVPKVILRTLLVMITGFLPLALISWIVKIDLAGMVSGLQVQKQHYV